MNMHVAGAVRKDNDQPVDADRHADFGQDGVRRNGFGARVEHIGGARQREPGRRRCVDRPVDDCARSRPAARSRFAAGDGVEGAAHLPATGALERRGGFLRVLAFLSPGVLMDNMPVEFLLEHSNVSLDMVYVAPGLPLPDPLPPHDVALVCVSELRENQALLRELSSLLASWPRPVVNRPDRIARLTRVGTWELLKSVPEIVIPVQVRHRPFASDSRSLVGEVAVETVLDGSSFPMIARPVDSHAGEGFAKLSCSSRDRRLSK